MKAGVAACFGSLLIGAFAVIPPAADIQAACYGVEPSKVGCTSMIAQAIVGHSEDCFKSNTGDETGYRTCTHDFCGQQCGASNPNNKGCQEFCEEKANGLFGKLSHMTLSFLQVARGPEDDLAKEMTHDLE